MMGRTVGEKELTAVAFYYIYVILDIHKFLEVKGEKIDMKTKRVIRLGILALLCAVVIIGSIFFPASKKENRPFSFREEDVSAITLKRAQDFFRDSLHMEVTDQRRIQKILQVLNNYSYDTVETASPLGGWQFLVILHTEEGDVSLSFNMEYISIKEGDMVFFYYGEPGYFGKIVSFMNEWE